MTTGTVGGQANFSYDFSSSEILALAQFFRPRQNEIPKELFAFCRKVQDELYNLLSIDEAEELCEK